MKVVENLGSVRSMRIAVVLAAGCALLSGTLWVYLAADLSAGVRRQAEIDVAAALANTLYAEGLQMGQATRNILLDPANPKAWTNHAAAARQFEATLTPLSRILGSIGTDSDVRRRFDSIGPDYRAHLAVQKRIHQTARAGDFAGARSLINAEDTPLWRRYKDSLLLVRARLQQDSKATLASLEGRCRLVTLLAWLSAGLLLLASLSAVAVSSTLKRRLTVVMEQLSDGARHASESSMQVSRIVQSVASGASQQSAAIQQISSSAEQIQAMAVRNGESADAARSMVAESQSGLETASADVERLVRIMERIQSSGTAIHKVLRVIDEIAFQTNLLALNAAVEASRAGQAGLGFGVVADEVRQLAHRCTEAGRESSALVETSIGAVGEGVDQAGRTAASMKSYIDGFTRVSALVQDVSTASREQTQGVSQVAKTVNYISQATQSAAASAQQGADAAVALNNQSSRLSGMVGELRAAISGGR